MGVRFRAAKRGFCRGEVAESSMCEWLGKDRVVHFDTFTESPPGACQGFRLCLEGQNACHPHFEPSASLLLQPKPSSQKETLSIVLHTFLLLLLAPRVQSWVSAVQSMGCVPQETVETVAGQGPRCEPAQVVGL